jgi:hypothetical protein
LRSASIFSQSCSWIPTFAQRCHSETAQVLHLRRERGVRGFEAPDDVLVVLARGERRHVGDGVADVTQRTVGRLERHVFFSKQRLDSADQLVHPAQALATRSGLGLFGLPAARRLFRGGLFGGLAGLALLDFASGALGCVVRGFLRGLLRFFL